ncbi:hypothetical protein G3N59_01070 [Paraburkholderia sp. Ac-20340]|uniref:hypothetical protein n=1 Tax=Paraburkholderia sp. Ac-20340 TaxID=2703888 RepID=UPI00197D63A4|nr:hypothetical protein [Paraburkholderia sp. Ac-20340]MBN3851958.1 hypothetical protein [Paraburkholderia sp. Ac-20340]
MNLQGNQAPIDGNQGTTLDVSPTEVVCKVAGITIFGAADDVRAACAALEARALPTYPDELTPDLREVLGWMCFQCAHIARAMRAAGVEIEHRAEDEQAHVIHWMVKLVLRHGANWRAEGAKHIEAWKQSVEAKGAA